MAKYLCLFRVNPMAPWPQDPVEYEKFLEKMYAAIDDLLAKGVITEVGTFLDSNSGYAIAEADGATVFAIVNSFTPYWDSEIQEIISYEKTKEVFRAYVKSLIEATK